MSDEERKRGQVNCHMTENSSSRMTGKGEKENLLKLAEFLLLLIEESKSKAREKQGRYTAGLGWDLHRLGRTSRSHSRICRQSLDEILDP